MYGERSSRRDRDCFTRGRAVTRVRCDQCGHKGPTRSFLRIRLVRTGLHVRREVQYTLDGKTFQGELRGKDPKGFLFVGACEDERVEMHLPKEKLTLL